MNEPPLITFVLIAYNQEKFIEEAVQGAFSQTYTPLEVILSDDCSRDRTFEIMQKLANAYKGPHKIILNRNKINRGISAHINRCMELANGELVVVAAGDDISLPERTVEIYLAWIDSGKKAFSLDSGYDMIDEGGNTINRPPLQDLPKEHQLLNFSKTLVNYVEGCTHAWHRKVFDVFGPLPNITFEDVAIPPRAMLLGKVLHIDKPLVKYRSHGKNMSLSTKMVTSEKSIDRIIHYCNDKIKICSDVIWCINKYKGTINDASRVVELEGYIININASREKLELRLKIVTEYPIIRLYYLFKYMFLYKLHRPDMIIVVYALSKTVYKYSRIMREKLLAGLNRKNYPTSGA